MAYINNQSKEEKKNSQKQKVKEALAKIYEEVPELFNSTDITKYLTFAARFHNFDVNNVILFYMQRPSATFVAPFKVWQQFAVEVWNDPNWKVLSDESKGQGIGILVPYILRKKEDGTESHKGRVVSYVDYYCPYAWDKTQVNKIPSPTTDWRLSESPDDCVALFDALRERAPFDIELSSSDEIGKRRYIYKEATEASHKDRLLLNYDLAQTARRDMAETNSLRDLDSKSAAGYYLLCSYIIKIFVSKTLKKDLNKYKDDDFQKICECVAFMVSSYFGLLTDEYIFFFVKLWGEDNPQKMLNILNTIQNAAHHVICMLEDETLVFKKMYQSDDIYDNDSLFDFDVFL